MRSLRSDNILDYEISAESKERCIDLIMSWLAAGEKRKYFVCANPHSLEAARGDAAFDRAVRNADLVVPDGIGVVIASKILGGTIRDRVTGSDIFWGLNNALNKEKRYSCFFLGSTEGNLQKIREKMGTDFPNIRVAGTYSPPFKSEFTEEDDRQMTDAINKAAPDVVWVGMTAPKQEKWVHRNKEKIEAHFIGPIGAVFDFYTGNVKRSRPIFQELGLEWLPRLLRQPRRLWRRNFISNPRFIMRVIRSKFVPDK